MPASLDTDRSRSGEDDEADGEAASSASTPDTAAVARKRRRSTYQARKDEKETLLQQIEELQRQVERLSAADRSAAETLPLRASVDANMTALAGAQSLLSSATSSAWSSPFATRIHLPVDPRQRLDCLVAMYDRKIELAAKVLLARTQFLDLRHDHRHTESFQLPNGDFVFNRLEVTPFGRAFSVKRIFDEMVLFSSQVEMNIMDHAGFVTVLEVEDALTSTIKQNRLLCSVSDTLHCEANFVLFSKFSEPEAYGVLAQDFVDQDDLYPYTPSRRQRKDLSSGRFVAACPVDVEGEPPIVSMTQWMTLRLPKAELKMTREEAIVLRENTRAIGDVMTKAMQQKLGLR